MKRLASAFVALAVLAAPVAIAQGKLDCGKAYKGFWDKLEREKYSKISPEQLAELHQQRPVTRRDTRPGGLSSTHRYGLWSRHDHE